MPCMDPYPMGDCGHSGVIKERDMLARFACAVFREGHEVPAELREWWAYHQERDRQREDKERAEFNRRARVAAIRAKLTEEEMHILEQDERDRRGWAELK